MQDAAHVSWSWAGFTPCKDTSLWMHIPYPSNKIYRGPEIYPACKILLNEGMSCATTIVWECIVSAGRKMAMSLLGLTRLPGVVEQQQRCFEGM